MRKRSSLWAHYTEVTPRKIAKCIHCLKLVSIAGGSNGNLKRHLKKRHDWITITNERQPQTELVYISSEPNETITEYILSTSSPVTEQPQQKKKRSSLSTHFIKDKDGKSAKCKHCSRSIKISKSVNGNINRHMRSKHPSIIFPSTNEPQQSKDVLHITSPQPNQITSETIITKSPSVTTQPHQSTSKCISKPPPNRKFQQIDRQVVKMIAKGYHTLRIVEEREMQKLIDMVSQCPGYKLPSRKTLSQNLISNVYNEVTTEVQNKIQAAQALSLTTDGWTSNNNVNYISITAHFIDEETKLCSALLACENYNDTHTSQNIHNFLKDVMEEWRITDKVAAVVSDNTATIKDAVRLGDWHSVECFAHLLNLIVQNATTQISDVLLKVKSIVEYFNQSPQGLQTLTATQKQLDLPVLKLKQDVSSRWNSTYDMLERILLLKDAVITTVTLLRSDLCLNEDDWEVIEEVLPLLKPFYELTVEISAEKNVTLSKIIVFCNLLQGFLQNHIALNEKVVAVQTALKQDMKNHFKDLEHNILYAECTVLDPRFKHRGFKNQNAYHVTIQNLRNEIGKVQLLPQSNQEELSASVSGTASNMSKKDSIWDDYDNEINKIIKPDKEAEAGIRELDQYLNEDYLDRKKDPFQWWHERRQIYPHLYAYILKRFCIVATSVPSERVFSASGQILNERRKLLKPSQVSKLALLHNNM